MKNPLTSEQIIKLNEIAKLPKEKQAKEFEEFLSTLNEEQVNFLKQSQTTQSCPFCGIANKKIKANTIYEDEEFIAVLDINPGNKGHILLFTKQHIAILSQVANLDNLMQVINKLAIAVFNAVKAHGTNVLISNGKAAGQRIEHFLVHIIPRFENDGINLSWQPKQVPEAEMKKIEKAIVRNLPKQTVKKERTSYKKTYRTP